MKPSKNVYGHATPRLAAACAIAAAALLGACGKQQPAPPADAPTAAAPAPVSATDARAAFDKAAAAHGFTVGQPMSARVVYVFFDPQCPHCGALWQASQPLLDKVRMVWLPVAFVSPKSLPQAALLLAAPDGRAAMDAHEARMAAGQGGMGTDIEPPADRVQQVRDNTRLTGQLGFESVPTIIYRVGNDGPYGVVRGGLSTADLALVLKL